MNLIINTIKFIKLFILVCIIINTDASLLQRSEYRKFDNNIINKETSSLSSCIPCNIVINSMETIKLIVNELESITKKKCTSSTRKFRDESRSWPPASGKYNQMAWGIPNKKKSSSELLSRSLYHHKNKERHDKPNYRLNVPRPISRSSLWQPNGYQLP